MSKEKAGPASPAKSKPLRHRSFLMGSIDDGSARRTRRFGEAAVMPALREAFSQRPDWRGFGARQLSVFLFLHGYLSEPAEDFDVEAALPFALDDRAGAA